MLRQLTPAPPTQIHLRDGEVVVFRRGHSPFWQCRYRLPTLGWVRTSTRQAALENAVRVACDYYDEARFRQRLGLAHKGWTFAQLAHETLSALRLEMDNGRGRSVYRTYITCIERYFLPYFQDRQIEQLTAKDVAEFEFWRNRQMQRVPMASTLQQLWLSVEPADTNRSVRYDAKMLDLTQGRGHRAAGRSCRHRCNAGTVTYCGWGG